ncbi:hypothetical protein TSUD_285700 [Trifolium subterraneum]|uniref:Transposase (putative) gypsy type domain-containing protein n=1 Tax=Trifolium subterraneum TaxID=3900 RepID=A0A2Z6NNJ0_TRISU|nr:hypothetical protein TSUD_285700 [Trifolium subterraneum]
MADEGVQRKIPVEKNINWVADDPRTTPSKFEFEENFPEDLFTDIEIPGHADWEVRIPGAKQRICTTFKNGGFPMYQIAFEHMGLRLPFTNLEMAIFNHLEVCPSQLHPNSLAFIRAFEIVAAYLQLAPTVPLFFHIFGIQRSRPRGNVTDKCGWTTVKIPEADQTILASMGPESLRNVVAESSVAVFKLLEVATFLNGRESKYLRERDEARALAKDFGGRLTVVEQDLLARDKALEDSEAELAKVKKELEDARGQEEKLRGKIAELEEQMSGLSLAEEEEKKLDPAGTYAKSSRAELIAKIYQIGDMQLDVASSSFQNALAQLQVLNRGI